METQVMLCAGRLPYYPWADYQVVGMPGSLVIDRDGVIFYRHIGPMSGELLAEKLAELN